MGHESLVLQLCERNQPVFRLASHTRNTNAHENEDTNPSALTYSTTTPELDQAGYNLARGLIRPFKGLVRPFKGLIRPFQGLIRPFKNLIRPLKGRIRPLRAL